MVGPVPALSEWALILMALMLISIASAFLAMPAVATAGSGKGFALRQFPFSAKSYLKTLAYTLILLPVAYAAIWMIWGSLEIQDIFMAPLCLAFVAYIAHVWKK